MRKIAVIDIGTLKVKLLIADATSSKVKTCYESNTLTRLGVRMSENDNKPQENYLEDTICELKRCKEVIEKYEVSKLRAVSTHALREMGEVGQDIAKKIKKEVGLDIEIISQDEEANLFFNAVTQDFQDTKDYTLVDVGGGSVQVLIGSKNKLKEKYLLKTGASYLFDRFCPKHTGDDFPTRKEVREMQKYIMEQLSEVPLNSQTPVIYGSSCIIDLFKTLKIKMEKFEHSNNHPFKTNVAEMENFLINIIPVPYDKREEMYNFYQKGYMWGIDKAFLNIISIARKQNSPYIIPTNSNINHGLALSLV